VSAQLHWLTDYWLGISWRWMVSITFQFLYTQVLTGKGSRGNSASIVSDYGLDDPAIEVRSPAEAKRIFTNASVSRPALDPTQPPVQWIPRHPSRGVMRGRSVTLIIHNHLVSRSWMSRSYTSSPPCTSIGVLCDCFTLTHCKEDGWFINSVWTWCREKKILALVAIETRLSRHMPVTDWLELTHENNISRSLNKGDHGCSVKLGLMRNWPAREPDFTLTIPELQDRAKLCVLTA
jgi:hypothetical protein